ncbi:MAG: GntR family transcriptional regulator [Rhizobiaceae bacterium]
MPEVGAKPAFAYKPLYMQVKESLIGYLVDGTWQPGQLIPSEIELARQTGVSQGTVRKALDAMTAEHLLVRHQGRGTYVAVPEESQILFRYYRLRPDHGEHGFPNSKVLRREQKPATEHEQKALHLADNGEVFRISRSRLIDGVPLIAEAISLPSARFDGFNDLSEIPNNVYQLYSERWGITVGRAAEKLKAVAASAAEAQLLGCAEGSPLLEIARIAYDLEDKPVELRISHCLTDRIHYQIDLK